MFQRINPDELNGRQKEIYNSQKSAALLADYGFNCIKLADDWNGTDFLAHHFDGTTTLRVQLKARLTIDQKYVVSRAAAKRTTGVMPDGQGLAGGAGDPAWTAGPALAGR